jgi:hypothetical protein
MSGTLATIRFRFATDEPVMPLSLRSFGAGASTLYVLAHDAFAPRDDGDAWETTIYPGLENLTWISFFQRASATEPFLPTASTDLVLTKHRRRFEPDAMNDVHFERYDAKREAASNEETDRLQAFAFLAEFPTPDTAALLAERLPRAVSSRETYAILWALGEVGPVAERALLARVDDEPAIRLECVESLSRLRSTTALPHFVRGLTTTASHANDALGPEVQPACLAHLVEYGDSTCLATLRAIATEHDGFDAWRPANAHEPIDGRDAVAGFSWIGPAVLRGLPATDRHWPRLAWTLDALDPTPALRDALLRRVIAAPHVPSTAFILLTSELTAPTDADFDRLARIAEAAPQNAAGSREAAVPRRRKGRGRRSRRPRRRRARAVSATLVHPTNRLLRARMGGLASGRAPRRRRDAGERDRRQARPLP